MEKLQNNLNLVRSWLDANRREIVRLRRELRGHPELSWKETQTQKRLHKFLQEQGITDFKKGAGNGFWVDIRPPGAGKMLAVRADMDALPLPDMIDTPYRSRVEGVCHACGHDFHMSIVAGLAAFCREYQAELPYGLRFIFQPAEEPIPSGAPKMIESGVLNEVAAMLGVHLEPELLLGEVSLTEGWVNAQSIRLDWRFIGSGGHSARPAEATQPLMAAVKVIERLQKEIPGRWHNADQPLVLTFTRLNSGEAYNAIPKFAEMTATLRITRSGLREAILAYIQEVNSEVQRTFGITLDFEAVAGAPPVVNDAGLIQKMRGNFPEGQMPFKIVENFRSMGGDDFGWYGEKIPVAMIRFGIARPGQKTHTLHSSYFDAPEEVLGVALTFLAGQILSGNLLDA